MAISAISSLGLAKATDQVQPLNPHKHGGAHSHSLADVDVQSTNTTTSATGKIGSRIDITA